MRYFVAICLLVFMLPFSPAAAHARPEGEAALEDSLPGAKAPTPGGVSLGAGVETQGEASPGAVSSSADAEEPRALFEKGNSFYESGDYQSAIEAYGSLVARGVESKDLYYNLANAYFKNGELGRAILFYERALRLSPRDEDTKANLSLVEAMLRDRQFIRKENRFQRALVWVNRNLSIREAVLLTSLFYLLFCALAVIFILRKTNFVRKMYRRLSILSPGRFLGLSRELDLFVAMAVALCLFVGAGASAWHKIKEERAHDRSVVIESEVAVYSGPMEDATLQFKIHEGTRVRIRARHLGWVQIELPGDLSGWIEAQAIEQI
jgi:tetratricopeptide (TPR) repeat protein